MSPRTRKRSHEEMNRKASETQDSSSTVIGDTEAATSQDAGDKPETSSLPNFKSVTAKTDMPPPARPSSRATSQNPPRSGQGSVPDTQATQAIKGETNVSTTKKPIKPQDDLPSDDTEEDEAVQPDSPMLDSEPEEQIEAFDWHHLQERYHAKMAELNQQEQAIMNEFNGLKFWMLVEETINRFFSLSPASVPDDARSGL